MRTFAGVFCFVLMSMGAGCALGPSATPAQQRLQIDRMADETLGKTNALYPAAHKAIQRASGYAVFDASGGKILYGGMDHGKGVVVDNATHKHTYMKMFELQPGLGFGFANFRLVFIFKTNSALHDFITSGWEFSTRASAAAKNQDQGGAYDLGYAISPDVTVYQLTEKGAIVGVSITGAKYWLNDELN